MSYQALPKELHIKDSPVAGQGLFAKEDIATGTYLGMSHIVLSDYLDNETIYRTPLGGFINHSEQPNCLKYYDDGFYFIKTIKKIETGEELFLKYSFYNINE
tara:strand:+ start:20 stop:325 length:306 start_codon:yes stop_codon:yes gene_type:complete